jgi:hypothetical protein
MPVWGQELARRSIGDPDAEKATRVILDRLTDYVWQLQRPAPEARPADGKE